MNKSSFLAGLFCVFAIGIPLFAQDILVTSTFDKRSANVNEEIRLTIRVTGSQGNIQAPRLPDFQGFDTFYTGRASHLTFVNGQSSSMVEFSYVLIPKVAGRFTLAPIQVTAGGRVFRTDAISVEILADKGTMGRATPEPAQAQPSGFQPAPGVQAPPVQAPQVSSQPDENIFVQAWIDKEAVYPNEQVLLSYSLYTRYDTRYEGFEEEPQISGFWIEEFPMDRNIERETVRVNGRRYIKADIRKIALFPTAAAEYTIQPGTLKVSVRNEPQQSSIFDDFFSDSFFSGGSFFARRESRLLRPAPIRFTVKPFPDEGKPDGFTGVVGDFRVSATVDKQEVKQNEPVTMTLIIQGQGNIETLNMPKLPELPEFRIYEADASSQLFKSGDVIGGTKTFEVVFIPKQAGRVVIPKLEFSFFNPQRRQYVTQDTPQFPLTVEESTEVFQLPSRIADLGAYKKNIEVEGRDIRYINEKYPTGVKERVVKGLYYGFAVSGALLTLLYGFGLWRHRTERIFAKDSALRRRKLARSSAASSIKQLKRLMKSKKGTELGAYYEGVDKVLTQYLSDKFNLSTFGTARLDLERQLEQALGSGDSLYQSILELYRLCDESRFARGTVAEEHKVEALNILQETIARVDKVRQ